MSASAALLVVDDNDDNRYTLTRRLQREGYGDLAVAVDGREALALMSERPFDLILLDIMMPQMNGYQVLERMKADARLRDVPVIMISALDEMESVVRCIELGAEDYLTKPFNPTLLRARVGASLEKKRLRDALKRNLDMLQQELAAARALQLGMLPHSFPQWSPARPIAIHALMQPAREVGGDLYDCFAVGEHGLCFLVGDVSGKGASAAMFMARARSLVRMAATLWQDWRDEEVSPARLLETVNRELCQNNADRMFVTLFLGLVDLRTGTMQCANAGHPAPYVLSPGSDPRRVAIRPCMPLGIRAAARFDDHTVTLAPRDTLFVCSDGVFEAADGTGDLFSFERLEALLRACCDRGPQDIVGEVKAAVDAFAGDAPQADDLTAMALSWLPGMPAPEADMIEIRALVLDGDLAGIGHARDALDAMAVRLDLPAQVVVPLQVALDEVLSNVVKYAWPEGGPHSIGLRIAVHGNGVLIEIEDDGIAFDPRLAAPPPPAGQRTRPGGVGIEMVRGLVDRLGHARVGGRNRTTLFKTHTIRIPARQQ